MKKHTLKALGFFMSLVLLFSLTAAYPTTNAQELAMQDDALPQGEMQVEVASKEPLLPTEIPTELISDEKIQEAGHARRLPHAEGDMNTVVLANQDGTHSMYLFSYPVKYTNENEGDMRTMSYQTICVESDGDYRHIWKGIVVVEEGDYLNTIAWPGV